MIQKVLHRVHSLWETHEIHMEITVLSLSLIFIGCLAYPQQHPVAEGTTLTPPPAPISTPKVPSTHSVGIFVTPAPDMSLKRAQIQQNITKTNQKIEELQRASLSLTAQIQKECGGQTNDCAKRLQSSQDSVAEEYERAQEQLRSLTASLGNL